jgi:hypothetical protein
MIETVKLVLQPGETCEGKTRWPLDECPNMKARPGDLSMDYEHYDCAVCGKHIKLDYEEMK